MKYVLLVEFIMLVKNRCKDVFKFKNISNYNPHIDLDICFVYTIRLHLNKY